MRIVMGIKYKVTMAPQGFRPLALELVLKVTFVHLLLATLDSGKCLDITKPAKYDAIPLESALREAGGVHD
jgi:hypothetical protein